MAFYIKRTYVDNAPNLEIVNIHYTWTPLGQQPDWDAHRETRLMPRGGTLVRGFGGTTLDESGMAVQTASQTIKLPDDGVRRKVIRLPFDIFDPAQQKYVEHYAFHHYFEIFRDGKREQSPLYTEEIVSKEVEFVDYQGTLGGMCIYWSINDWDAPQYQPTEVPEFIEKYGEDSPYRSFKFYGSQDMEEFSRIRAEMLKALPLPRRFVGKIRGPKGAQIVQSWHVGGMWTPNRTERWESYWGNNVQTL
ncbi:MAG: hypothetical protein AB7G75_00935 [Candidatus Binatia bacterium]